MIDNDFHQRDLGPLRTAAEPAELAQAMVSIDGCRLADSDPLAPLTRDIARSLIEAGLTVHRCVQHDPLYRLGGVCVLAVPAESGTGYGGIAVSWTVHDLLLLDWDRYGMYTGTQQAMNTALGGVLRAFGYPVEPFGSGGAWLVTRRRDKRLRRRWHTPGRLQLPEVLLAHRPVERLRTLPAVFWVKAAADDSGSKADLWGEWVIGSHNPGASTTALSANRSNSSSGGDGRRSR